MNKRPVFLNLLQIHFPITALVSIAHRISGILLIFMMPLFIWMLAHVEGSADDFLIMQQAINGCLLLRLVLWVGISAAIYHLLAGVRHLLLDMGLGHSLCCAQRSAWLMTLISLVLIMWSGVFLW